MKSITIHKIDDETEKALVEIAKREGISLNKLIKRLLRERLGLDETIINNRQDFVEFCGIWTPEEADEFDQSIKAFSVIREDEWA